MRGKRWTISVTEKDKQRIEQARGRLSRGQFIGTMLDLWESMTAAERAAKIEKENGQ